MTRNRLYLLIFIFALLISSCTSLQKTTTGQYAGIETQKVLIGKDGKSTIIGAKPALTLSKSSEAYFTLSKNFDKIAEEIAYIDNSQVESFSDANNLKALKISFEFDNLFEAPNKLNLKKEAKSALISLAKILNAHPTVDIIVLGHSDNVGTLKENKKISDKAAKTVSKFLISQQVDKNRIKLVLQRNFLDPVANNDTKTGRAKNRRVELLLYANEQMIKSAKRD